MQELIEQDILCTELSKSQLVRLADVFAIGPLMVYGGYKLQKNNKLAGLALMLVGVSTVVYNGSNYLANREGY